MASRSPTPAAAPSESAARRSSQGISRSYICLNPPSAASHGVRGPHCCVAEPLPCCSFCLRKVGWFVATPGVEHTKAGVEVINAGQVKGGSQQ